MSDELKAAFDAVHEKAQAVFSLVQDPTADQLEAIIAYSESFKNLEALGGLESGEEEVLQELQREHAQVLRQAEKLQSQVSGDMHGLQTKGKAVLKYLDVLPKRISSRRPRKG